MYLYVDKIEFAPFGSEENRGSRSAEIVDPPADQIPRPSPKSIYRLADKVRSCSLWFSKTDSRQAFIAVRRARVEGSCT